MKNLDFEWLTDEFMLYCRSTQLREKSMASYEQALRLFVHWYTKTTILKRNTLANCHQDNKQECFVFSILRCLIFFTEATAQIAPSVRSGPFPAAWY